MAVRPTRHHLIDLVCYRRSTRHVLLALTLLAVGWAGPARPREPTLAAWLRASTGPAVLSTAGGAGWTLTANMTVGRSDHTATLLANGRVLVAGGDTGNGPARSAELYNPATGTWTATGPMATPRARHTATLLANGLVLVAGGNTGSGPSRSAELYNPATGTWTATGPMATARALDVAVRLADGRVLVMGGARDGGAVTAFASAEIYDPTSGRWSPAAPMHAPRLGLAAVLLRDGRVLVAGGYTFDGNAQRYQYAPAAELYDPRDNRWSSGGTMTGVRADATATLLADARVLVAGGTGSGGSDGTPVATAELYDPRTNSWSTTGPLHTARSAQTATLLPNGRVLVVGGTTQDCCTATRSVEVYDPRRGTWAVEPSLTDPRVDHTATLLPGGSVLVAGGFQLSAPLSSAEVATASIGTAPAAPPAGPPPAPPSCAGPRDLLVDGTQLTLRGQLTFESVCLIRGAIVVARSGLAVRAGIFYLDATSRIDADGLPGSAQEGAIDCAEPGTGTAAGDSGGTVLIQAHQAVVLGTFSAKGGDGATGCGAEDYARGFDGGHGGQITIQAASLVLRGMIYAEGGSGGSGAGVSGNGGTITMLAPGAASLPTQSFTVSAGSPGGGTRGGAGRTILQTPTPAQLAALPPLPGPLLAVSGPPPRLLPLLPARGPGLRCGTGDLDVGRGQARALGGVHIYGHVCVHDGGILAVVGALTLIAATISVDSRSAIVADGVSTTGVEQPAAQRGRGVPPPGARGKPGTEAILCCAASSPPPRGAAGGGTIALVGRTVVLAGTLSARGADGRAGEDGASTPSNCGRGGQGAGGGAGGGIYIRTMELDLSGSLRVDGGKGGPGGHDDCSMNGVVDGGARGAPGFARLIVETLRTPAGALPAVPSGVLERGLPVDPAPPSSPGALYWPTVGRGSAASLLGHGLSGAYLTFYQRYGGLNTFGYPRSEPFMEQGRLMQYTDRFLLEVVAGRVRTAPLGRLLLAGRSIPRITPFASTHDRLYFAGTGHSLGGTFLAYWRAHGGATLLGAPISEVRVEGNGDGSGRRYPLQWFENGRLEYHAELAGTRYAVELGLVGLQALQQRGWLP